MLEHKFYEMGTGIYSFVSIWSAPSKSLAETNTNAYNGAIASRPSCCNFICDHCGTPIVHHFIIQDSKGMKFSVGSSCIDKLGDYVLTTAAKKAEKSLAQKVKAEKRAAKYAAEKQVQRDTNGGFTDFELAELKREQQLQVIRDKRAALVSGLIDTVKYCGNDFCKSIVKQMVDHGQMPQGRGAGIFIDVLAKLHGRRDSKAYHARYDELLDMMQTIENQLTAL